MAKKQKPEAAPVADVPVPTTPIETSPVGVAESPEAPKRKRRRAKTDAVAGEPLPAATTEPADNPKPGRKSKATAPTLATIFAGYLQALDERGGSTGTIASYRAELEMAGTALGVDTPVTNLTDAQVATYFESDPVTKKRNGKPKSPLSIDKTRRVLRQALVWAGHADLVPSMEAAS